MKYYLNTAIHDILGYMGVTLSVHAHLGIDDSVRSKCLGISKEWYTVMTLVLRGGVTRLTLWIKFPGAL